MQNGGDRAFGHQQLGDVVVDAEYAFDSALRIPKIDGAGFQHPSVARPGQIPELVYQRWIVLPLDRLQNDAGSAAASLTMGYMPVFDHRNRMLGVVAGNVVDDNLAALSKLCGNRHCQPLQELQIHDANPLPYKYNRTKQKNKQENKFIS
jgi:hypothetical protein